MTNPSAVDALPRSAKKPRHEDFPRLGRQIFERVIRLSLRPDDTDKFVAIDVDSQGYEIDGNDHEATERLLTRFPEAQIWLVRVGQQAAHRI
jgi:hypothetical protein